MAVELIGGAEVRFKSKEEREKLGRDFLAWINQVEDDRRQMVLDTYIKVQENLDGRSEIKSIPWRGASNAFAPLTGTYADALQSRLFDAATTHDPTNLVLPRGAGEIIPGVDFEKWADWWQRISRWAERDDYDFKNVMELVTLVATHFGDSWVYLPWEEQSVADVEILRNGKPKLTPRTLYAKPMPKVLHPKDVFIRWDAVDHQLERLVGFQFDLDLPTLEEWAAKGIYDEEVAEDIRTKLKGAGTEDRSKTSQFAHLGIPIEAPDEFDANAKRRMKLSEESGNRAVKMVKMFSRVDMDGDGVPEEVVYDVVKSTGQVAYARYANYSHRERPLIHYWFKKRPGAIYNIGVGEMMLNPQDIVNTSLRDHFDNNKVQNSSITLVRKNSGIKKGTRAYPWATLWVNDPSADVKLLDMGKNAPSKGLEAIPILEKWAQFIVGLSDFQLGQEPKSRTPATTSMASLEQAGIRPKRIIEVMRVAMRRQHRQILMLYFQNGKAEELAKVAAVEPEDQALFIQAMGEVTADDMDRSLSIDPDVASDALNRGARRQEAMALDAQNDTFWQRINNMMNLIAGALADPIAKAIFLAQAKSYIRFHKRILDTFEERDQREILPEALAALLEGVTSVPAEGGGPAGPSGSSPAEAAQGLVTAEGPAAGPVAPEGRPVAGQQRVPAQLPQANGG